MVNTDMLNTIQLNDGDYMYDNNWMKTFIVVHLFFL